MYYIEKYSKEVPKNLYENHNIITS